MAVKYALSVKLAQELGLAKCSKQIFLPLAFGSIKVLASGLGASSAFEAVHVIREH